MKKISLAAKAALKPNRLVYCMLKRLFESRVTVNLLRPAPNRDSLLLANPYCKYCGPVVYVAVPVVGLLPLFCLPNKFYILLSFEITGSR